MNHTPDLPAPSGSPFDGIRRVTPEGREFWSGRDLMSPLGYDSWRRPRRVCRRVPDTGGRDDMARLGSAGRVWAGHGWLGVAWLGVAWQGRQGLAGRGTAWLGMARQAGLGAARRGLARQG